MGMGNRGDLSVFVSGVWNYIVVVCCLVKGYLCIDSFIMWCCGVGRSNLMIMMVCGVVCFIGRWWVRFLKLVVFCLKISFLLVKIGDDYMYRLFLMIRD